jgi:hypothetical protein
MAATPVMENSTGQEQFQESTAESGEAAKAG